MGITSRLIDAAERKFGEKLDYMRDIASASPAAFYKFALFLGFAKHRKAAPLDAYYLAAGEYGIDLQTTSYNLVTDHVVSSAVRFFVDACSPDGMSYDFRQDLGMGHLAMRPSLPTRFSRVNSA